MCRQATRAVSHAREQPGSSAKARRRLVDVPHFVRSNFKMRRDADVNAPRSAAGKNAAPIKPPNSRWNFAIF